MASTFYVAPDSPEQRVRQWIKQIGWCEQTVYEGRPVQAKAEPVV
jgi:hypothetical protein